MTKRSTESVSYASRILSSAFSGWGARIGLTWVIVLAFVACFSPFLANTMPLIIGGQMGYFAGRFDMIGMRIVEVFEAIPVLFLLLAFVAFFGRSVYIIMIIIGVTGWSGYARYIREHAQ